MDVHLFHTPDGGDIKYTNGQAVMADGLETAAYLSLFGGNEDDNGTEATEHLQWWGNLDEPIADRRQRSATQSLLRALPATSGNLGRARDAAERDLAWFKQGFADSVTVVASIPARNTLKLEVTIVIGSNKVTFPFFERWQQKAAA
jgi:phage gp46-like protein